MPLEAGVAASKLFQLLLLPCSPLPLVACLCVQAEIMAQAATASYAMFLLCIQHTFEGVYTAPKVEFDRTAAGLWGTSFLSMPWWWQWASCGIEHHHFHHLFPSMPCYRMKVRDSAVEQTTQCTALAVYCPGMCTASSGAAAAGGRTLQSSIVSCSSRQTV
jgi:fatty acid desaturase